SRAGVLEPEVVQLPRASHPRMAENQGASRSLLVVPACRCRGPAAAIARRSLVLLGVTREEVLAVAQLAVHAGQVQVAGERTLERALERRVERREARLDGIALIDLRALGGPEAVHAVAHQWAADAASELVAPVGRLLLLERAAGVQRLVAEVFERGPPQVVGPRLGDHLHDATGREAVLRLVLDVADLEFLD